MLLRSLTGTVTAAVLILTSSASAQFFGGGCSTCGTSRPVTNVASCGTCTPIRPVYSACYQTIPVTTYRKERQTVREPYYKTAYEDREVTVYEPVTRKKTIEVPTVSYKTVVENRTVHRDLGRWQTNYTPVAKCAPCQIDPRPGLLGWLNRTGYSIRSSFTPDYRTTRQYVPNMVACSVPVSRQVAVRGTRKVVVNDTEMVARKKTERVEVRRLAWRDREITVSRPVTAYRTVPVGTATAFGYGYPGTSVARIIDEGETREAPLRMTTSEELEVHFVTMTIFVTKKKSLNVIGTTAFDNQGSNGKFANHLFRPKKSQSLRLTTTTFRSLTAV